MTDARWRRMWELFHGAAELPVGERDAWLAAACDDAELCHEVAELLAAESAADGVLSRPPTYPTSIDSAGVLSDRLVGERVGPYRILSEIGEGGMGVVYRAEQEAPVRRTVALKLIKLGMDTREVVARFEAERQALALMDHPGIATVFDAGATAEGRPYFVMEHVEGLAIDRWCDEHRLDLRQRVELVMAVCRAVQHAHQKGIIHRDLKPSNVLVLEREGRPQPKVIDFGIAKAIETRSTGRTVYTELGRRVGTPEYMSPEQAGDGVDVDTRSDVYSLGVLLYELLVGALPFDGAAPRAAAPDEHRRLVDEPDPPPPSVRFASLAPERAAEVARMRGTTAPVLARDLRGDLDRVIGKAMARDRALRYDAASQLAADLGRYLADQPVVAAPPTRSYRLAKFLRRHRAGVAMSTAAGALLVTFAVVSSVQARRIAAALERAETQRLRAEAVSGFLVDLFAVSDPELGRGGEVSAREILDRGAARIPRELEGQPQTRAALMDVMGRVYQNLGLYEQALRLQRQALAARRRLPGAAADLAATLDALGLTRSRQGDSAEARRLLGEALALRGRLFGAESPEVAATLHHLAEVLHDEGDLAGAEARYRRALEIRRGTQGVGHREVAESLDGLSVLSRDQGKYEESESFAREALAVRRRLFGERHPAVAESLDTLGLALYYREDYAAAEPLYRQALAIREAMLGPQHPAVAQGLSSLGLLLRKKGDLAGAEPVLRRALEVYRRSLGDEHPYVAAACNNLGRVLQARGDPRGAEKLFREALRRWESANHPNVAAGCSNLAEVLVQQGHLAEAELHYRRALAVDRGALGDGHRFVAGDWEALAAVLESRGRPADAEQALRHSLEIRRKLGAGEERKLAHTLLSLGRLRLRAGDVAAAEPLLREAESLADSLDPPDESLSTAAREALVEARRVS